MVFLSDNPRQKGIALNFNEQNLYPSYEKRGEGGKVRTDLGQAEADPIARSPVALNHNGHEGGHKGHKGTEQKS